MTYNQVTSTDNIHMDAVSCKPNTIQPGLRYICEVSNECTALFMYKYYKPKVSHSHGRK